jgi:hypothetical protein
VCGLGYGCGVFPSACLYCVAWWCVVLVLVLFVVFWVFPCIAWRIVLFKKKYFPQGKKSKFPHEEFQNQEIGLNCLDFAF